MGGHFQWLVKMSMCVPGSVGNPNLALGAVCRALVGEDVRSGVVEE